MGGFKGGGQEAIPRSLHGASRKQGNLLAVGVPAPDLAVELTALHQTPYS